MIDEELENLIAYEKHIFNKVIYPQTRKKLRELKNDLPLTDTWVSRATFLSGQADDLIDKFFDARDKLDLAMQNGHLQTIVFCKDNLEDIRKRIAKMDTKLQFCTPRSKDDAITDRHIEQARDFPIEDLIEFNRSGFANCLWHNEKTPSMKLMKDNKVYCFGCKKMADSISVYMEINNADFRTAVLNLQ